MSFSLLDLPHEVLHGVLANVDPQDLAGLCCCHALNDFIKMDRLLHKELYLRHFDMPPQDSKDAEQSWGTQLKELVNFQKILESASADLKSSQLETVAHSVEYLLTTASPESSLNIPFLTKLFESQQNTKQFLCGSKLFEWAKAESWGHLSTTRLRRDIGSMLTELKSDRSVVQATDLPSESSIVTEDSPEEAPLARVSIDDTEDHGTYHCNFNYRIADEGNPGDISGGPSQSSLRQLSAKLHCLYGAAIDTVRKDTATSPRYSLRSDTAPIHPYARALVYDLRQHTEHTRWGPFLDDGTQDVDWEKVEAIMIILNHNVKMSTEPHRVFEGMMEVQNKPFVGASPNSFVSPPSVIPMEPKLPLEAQDPYNVTGTWMRIVCFLDYHELYSFNFDDSDIPIDQPRQPLDTDEAIRLITMKVHITKIMPPGEEDSQRLPVVHFTGTSSSLRPSFDPNANSKLKGTVRLTRQGEVRWTTFSVYHGEERWRSEGIQVGGVQSARGVLGFWFDKNHDEHGPAGPTAFWKSHDGIEEQEAPNAHSPMSHFTIPLY